MSAETFAVEEISNKSHSPKNNSAFNLRKYSFPIIQLMNALQTMANGYELGIFWLAGKTHEIFL